MRRTAIILLALSLSVPRHAGAQTNSWANGLSSTWQTTVRWSLHAAPAASQSVLITNTGAFTVTINAQTPSQAPGSLAISSLVVSNPLGNTTLSLINAPGTPSPLVFTVTNSATIGNGAVLNIDDVSTDNTGLIMNVSNLVVNGNVILQSTSTISAGGATTNYNVHLGSTANSTGSVSIFGGSLFGKISIGEQGLGSLIISNGFLKSTNVDVGAFIGGHGLWQIAGGTSTITNLNLGVAATSTGEMTMVDGLLNTAAIGLGVQGCGSLVISNGFLQSTNVTVGVLSSGHGLWQIAGGTSTVASLTLGSVANSTGEVFMTGGQLAATLSLGGHGLGSLVISNGVFQTGNINVGALSGGHGLWQIDGGTSTVGNVLLGTTATSTGELTVAGGLLNAGTIGPGATGSGSLAISNGTINAVELDLASGLNGGGAETGVGTVTVAGGNLNLSANMYIGYLGTGVVWVTGGELDVINPASNHGLIRLVAEGSRAPYLSQLVCSGGVLRATEVDIGHPDAPLAGLSSWTIAGGTSIVNNAVYVSDNKHTGLLTISGGLLQTSLLDVGTVSGGGTVMITGGALQISQALNVGLIPNGISQLTVDGGTVTTTGVGWLGVGGLGPGQITVSSGLFNSGTIYVGTSPLSFGNQPGTLTVNGGTVHGKLLIGEGGPNAATGTVWFAGGNLGGNFNDVMYIGDSGVGNMYVLSNALFRPSGLVFVGNQSGALGSLNIQGGTSYTAREIDSLGIGLAAGSTGSVWVTDGLLQAGSPFGCGPVLIGVLGSGQLSLTNSSLLINGMTVGSQGTFECVSSQFSLGAPCATANNNVMRFVNSTGGFFSPIDNTGTIVANNSTLTFDQFVNNTGCIVATNGSVLFSGGITNSGAVLLSPSQFCITSIVATGSDIAITWPTFGGNHYRVQSADSPTDTFSDVTADIVAAGTGFGTTNYVDSGALANNPRFFYRIHQVY